MATSSRNDILKAFDFYRNSLFAISNDLGFWKVSLENMIKSYQEEPNLKAQLAFQSIFAVYDLPHNSPDGYLKVYKESFKVHSSELQEYKNSFFDWVMNLSILKAYNSCELLLLRSIQLAYFPALDDPFKNRKAVEKLNFQIRNSLIKADTNNNKHLIEFLKLNCNKFKIFSGELIRIDFKTTWQNFFELVSILRNVIAHNSSMLNLDTHNHIKSISKDIFEHYFDLRDDENGYKILFPKGGDHFLNFINLVNDFALNSAKFIFDEPDLNFLDMSS